MSAPIASTVLRALRDAPWLTRERARAYTAILAGVAAAVSVGWALASRSGLDPIGKPLGTDFLSFWAASKLALAGRAAEVYVPAVHGAAQRAAFGGADVGYAAFFYPPTYLLLCLPLALLPYLGALAAWLGATGYAYWRVARAALGRVSGLALPAIAFPAVLINVGHGQNAFLTSALFGAAALALPRRPILAGLCFGALAVKPHLGILIPFALLAAGRWKTIGAAAAAVAAGALGSVAVFGTQAWRGFLAVSPLARATLEQGLVGPEKMASLFAAMRVLHGSVAAAYAAQLVGALAAAVVVMRVARRAESEALGPSLIAGTLLTTPFLLDYDLILLGFPLAWVLRHAERDGFLPWEKLVLASGFVLPLVSRVLAGRLGLPVAPAVALAVLWLVARRALAVPVQAPAGGAPAAVLPA